MRAIEPDPPTHIVRTMRRVGQRRTVMRIHPNKRVFALAVVLLATTVGGGAALAGPSVADKCEAGRNKLAGSYLACREKAEAAAILKNAGTPDFSKCTAKFAEKWDGTETKAAGDCPDDVTTAPMQTYLDEQAAAVAAIITGGEGIPTCGDGIVNAVGEQCDGLDLDGTDCSTFGYAQGGVFCTPGCRFNVIGCSTCTGLIYDGACWYLGNYGESCDQVCAAHDSLYAEDTRTSAGSDGGNST